MAFRLSTKRFGLVTPRPGSAATLPSALSQLRSAQNRLASTYAEAKGQGASTATGNDADSDKPRRPSRKGNYKPKRSPQKSARGPRQNFGADGAFVARPLFRNPPGTQAKYIEDRERYVLDTYSRPKIVMNQGIGAMLYDLEGKGYIDFTSGIGVANLGHYDEGFATKVKKQVNLLVHSSNLFHNYHAPTLCRLLVQLTQAQAANTRISRAFLSNSGTEANEAAIKFARKYAKSAHSSNPSKYEIVSFNGSFHGRTFGSLSATPNPKYSDPFEPLVPGFKVGNFNDVDAIDSLVTENTAGVIVEPVQGEGGIYVATPEFLHKLRARCDEVGAVLIYDEIQCGLSRTGSFWAHCHVRLGKEGVDPATKFAVPDILTSAKALANGLPIGATLVSEEIAQHIKPGDHGTTFGGNPLIATAASYFLRYT
ncbi:acetylornithine aminotransferase [Ascosphaera atra]|nr:acetylornithine aminotransferase [Ascosphaera atra]